MPPDCISSRNSRSFGSAAAAAAAADSGFAGFLGFVGFSDGAGAAASGFARAHAELPCEWRLHGRASVSSPRGRATSIAMRDVSMNERAKWSAAAAAASGVRKPTKPKRRERPAAVRITRTSVTSEA